MRFLIALLCFACSLPSVAANEIEWDALVPQDYDPSAIYSSLFDEIYGEQQAPDGIADGDSRGEKLMDAIDKAWREAPLKQSLDNTEVRMAGSTPRHRRVTRLCW